MSNSDSENDSEYYYSIQCKCQQSNEKKKVFICIYKSNDISMTLISNLKQLLIYRQKYMELSSKTDNNINNIWDDLQILDPVTGYISIKNFNQILNEELRNNKKRLKKPIHFIAPITTYCHNCNSDSEVTDTENMSNLSVKCELHNTNVNQNAKVKVSSRIDNLHSNHNDYKNSPNKKAHSQKDNSQNNKIESNNNNEKSFKTDITSNNSKNKITNTPIKNHLNEKNNKCNTPNFKKPKDIIKSHADNITKSSNLDKHLNFSPSKNKEKPNVIDTTENKLTKKKLKKMKQKQKKLEVNSNRSTSSSISESSKSRTIPDTSSKKKKKSVKKENEIEIMENEKDSESEQPAEETNTSEDNLDFLTDSESMPTMIAELVKRKTKSSQKVKVQSSTDCTLRSAEVVSDKTGDEEFVLYTRKRNKAGNSTEKSMNDCEKAHTEALTMIFKNNIEAGIKYLTKAISLNSNDHRFYLNRSFCYLRVSEYNLALTDAKYVLLRSSIQAYLFIANLRAGQAQLALKNYHQAEMFFKEAAFIHPENYHIQRELMRVKITHIISMGYSEKAALLALKKCSSKTEALQYLMDEKHDLSSDNFENRNLQIKCNNYDEVIYESDDDETSNNIKTLNKILDYQFEKLNSYPVLSKFLNTTKNPLDAKKKIPVTVNNKSLVNKNVKKSVKEKAIWVGSLTSKITDNMLKEYFNQFGKVISIYRPSDEKYCFINFEKLININKILENSHKISGTKLLVKSTVK